MARDEEWWARKRERLARLQAQMADDGRDTNDQVATADTERVRETTSPVRRPTRGRVSGVWFLAVCILAIFVLGEVAMTLSRFTGMDIDDAKRLGRATVLSCERHGPVGAGFGYWDRCTAEVTWENGQREWVTPRKQGFFKSNEIGRTVTIGDLGWSKGGRSLARQELPSRPLVTLVAGILGFVALMPAFLLLGAVWFFLRGVVRRLSGAGEERGQRSA
jgi:hypothetical protein